MGVWGLEVLQWLSVAKLEIKVHRVPLYFPFLISIRVNEMPYCGNTLAVCYSGNCPGVILFVGLIGLGLASDSATYYPGQIN